MPETAARTNWTLSAIRLIVGLGNPGTQYEGTRHNAGAFFVRLLAKRHGLSLTADRNALGESARGVIAGHDLRLLIPETFMNESGRSVAAMSRYYRIDPDAILIAHDELDVLRGSRASNMMAVTADITVSGTSSPHWVGTVTSGDCVLASAIRARQKKCRPGY